MAAALALTNIGQRVSILENTDYSSFRHGEHIPPSAISSLLHIGLSPDDVLNCSDHLKSSGIRSFWAGKEHYIDYWTHHIGFGLNLSRPEFDSRMAQAAEAQGAVVITNAKFTTHEYRDSEWSLQYYDDKGCHHLRSRFVVDASGRRAVFARRLGERVIRLDSQIAATRLYEPVCPDNYTTLTSVVIEPCSIGWWYLCPLASKAMICMLFTDSDLLARAPGVVDLEWYKYMSEAPIISALLRDFSPRSISFCSATTQYLSNPNGNQWIAIGDSAYSFDPLSGQGISKGIRHGWTLGAAVAEYLEGREDFLEHAILDAKIVFSEYQRTRLEYYQLERRWADSKFWSRRSSQIDSHI